MRCSVRFNNDLPATAYAPLAQAAEAAGRSDPSRLPVKLTRAPPAIHSGTSTNSTASNP